MLSMVAIGNSALAKLGAGFVIDFDDESKAARALKEAFPRVRDAMLRSHIWSFSLASAQLAALISVPLFQYKVQYQLPADLLRLVQVGDCYVGLNLANYINAPDAEYRIEGRMLLSAIYVNTGPLDIRYVRRVTDTTLWDSLFDEAMACKLAVEISNTLTQSDTLKELAGKEFKAVLAQAARANALELPPVPIASSSWEMSRL
jgi:hypothetical protein